MKCPKCGNEIKEDHLYCDICGEEIRIVPDFDATVDDNIDISLTGVIDTAGVIEEISKVDTKPIDKAIDRESTKEISVKRESIINETSYDDELKDIGSEKKPDKSFIIKALVLTGAICAVLVVLGITINNNVNKLYNIDYQYEKAFSQYEEGKYEESIKTLKRALNIDENDSRIKLLMSDDYYSLNKIDEANAVLYELLDIYPDDPVIYERIIKNYEAKEDYQAINSFLSESSDDLLKETYNQYLAEDVRFSIEEGSYDEIMTLELSANDNCTIFYTLDGKEASKTSLEYTEPIVLDAGEYVINAIAINKYGIYSNNIAKEYVIDFYVPDAPVLKTVSGTFNVPTPIEVSYEAYETCYYTIDGDDPTRDDEIYMGPISMCIGKHTYKFATISEKGISSDVVSAEISLDLITLIDIETAKNNLVNFLVATGKPQQGFSYVCEQATVVNNTTYYIINEYQQTETDNKLTGNHYAVDVLTGLTFRAILNKQSGEYTLEALI